MIAVVAFYGFYTLVRNTQGSAAVSSGRALANARVVIRLERTVGIFHEQAVQAAFVQARLFMRFWNVFYASAHFVVTGVALVWLFRSMPGRYRFWRTVLAVTTALALAGYALFPLLPPRLLPATYGFVDSLRAFGGLWSFESGGIAKLSNQYAAMPSLHVSWALWSAAVFWPAARSPRTRAAVAAYPALAVFAIVVTANHYFLDAVAGAITMWVGYLVTRLFAGGRGPRAGARWGSTTSRSRSRCGCQGADRGAGRCRTHRGCASREGHEMACGPGGWGCQHGRGGHAPRGAQDGRRSERCCSEHTEADDDSDVGGEENATDLANPDRLEVAPGVWSDARTTAAQCATVPATDRVIAEPMAPERLR